MPGTAADVRVVRDRWGVPHIYARSTDDLFFAQGYVMAQDRLWQMEMWRRAAEGRLAEVLGPAALPRDRQARLLKYRGPMDDREFASYHPEGRRIMSAFVQGVNAFIDSHTDRLPVEFVLTGIKPERWTPETMVLRPATLADAAADVQLAAASRSSAPKKRIAAAQPGIRLEPRGSTSASSATRSSPPPAAGAFRSRSRPVSDRRTHADSNDRRWIG